MKKPTIVFDLFGVIYSECCGINNYLINLIKELKLNGYKIAILSNIDRKSFESYFKKYNFENIFDEIFLSSDLGVEKPNPLIFEKVKEILNCSFSDIIFIDDQFSNVRVAEKLGIKIHHFESFEKFLNFIQSEDLI